MPNADFNVYAENKNYKAPAAIYFENQSSNADSYQWFVNGDLVSSDFDLDYEFMEKGDYTIKLIATGCDDIQNSSAYTEEIIIKKVPTRVNSKELYFEFPANNLLPDTINDPYYGLELYAVVKYNGSTVGTTDVYTVEDDFVVFNTAIKIYNLKYGSQELTVELWDANEWTNDSHLMSLSIRTREIQEDYYPEVLYLEQSGGYKAEIVLSY
ncbi:MAG: hypothetical protein GY810_04830 [Aureispira sp.]|nr:hypothetical protein [Aureispira sp.]